MKLKKMAVICIATGILGIVLFGSATNIELDPWKFNSDIRMMFGGIVAAFTILSVFCLLSGVYILCINTKRVVRRKGVVLQKNTGVVTAITVEFSDGTRANLMAPPNIVVGDKGVFCTKANFVVAFSKMRDKTDYI